MLILENKPRKTFVCCEVFSWAEVTVQCVRVYAWKYDAIFAHRDVTWCEEAGQRLKLAVYKWSVCLSYLCKAPSVLETTAPMTAVKHIPLRKVNIYSP